MHSQLRGHQTLLRLVGKRRRLPPDVQSNPQSSTLGPSDLSNVAPIPLSPENDNGCKTGKEHTWVNLGGKENASGSDQSATCPICGRSLPGADGAINAHIDACLARGSVSANRPPRKTTQTTLATFTSPRAKLGPGSKSLPSSTSKGLAASKGLSDPLTPGYKRSISLPATLPLIEPWKDAGLDPRESPAESPGAKRRKRIQGSFVFDASEGGKGSGLDATAKGRVVESEPRRGCLEQSPEGPESVEAVPVASGVKDWPQLGSRRSEIDSPVECPGASKRGEEAHLFGPVPIPGGPCDTQPQTGNALEERSRLQKLGQVLGPTCSLEELDTWAVGQWRFEDAASLCAVGRPICLVREPDNPKDANAILVALVGPEATFGPKESALGVESRGGKKSALQGGRGAASDRGAAAFGRPKAGVNKTNVEKKRLVDGSGELQASDGAHSTGRLQEGGEGTRKDSLSKGGDNVSNMDVSNMGTTPTRTSPRKRKRDAFSTSSPARQKDTSPVREPKPKQPGKKGAVEEPRVIGYLPAVIAEHLAPVMDRFGTVFDGEVTVLPQCAGAAAGIRIRRPASIGPGGLAGGLEEGRTECRESGDGTVGRLKGGRAEGKNSGNGTGGRLEEGRAERRDSEDGAGKRGRRCDSDSRENLKRPTEQEHGFAGETERRAAEGGLGGPDTPRGTGRKGPVIAGICGAAPETTAPCFEQIAEGPSGADGLGEGDRQEHVAAADSRWRAACEAAARARAALVCDPSLPKYQGNFLYLVRTVLDADGHLFSDEETARLRGIGGLGGEGQRLLVRLFQRKGPWFRMSSLSYADVQNLPAAVLELLVRGYLLSSVQSAAYPNGGAFGADVKAAEGASPSSGEVPGMTDWGKPTGSDGAAEATGGQNRGARARRRSQRLAGTSDLLTNGDNEDRRGAEFVVSGVQRGASGNFGDEIVRGATEARSEPRWDPRAPEVLDAAYVRERVGVLNVGELRELLCALGLKTKLEVNGAKRDELLRWIVDAACDVMQTTPWGQGCHVAVLEKVDELAGECVRLPEELHHLLWRVQRLFFLNGEQDLSAFLLVDMGVCKYPRYRCSRAWPVFRTRAELLAYEKALDVAQRMDEAVEAADTAAALQLLATARRGLTQNAPPGDASLGVAIDGQRFVEQGTDGRDAPRDLGSPGGPGTEVVEGGPLPPGIKDKGVWDNGRATSTDLREAPGTLEAHSDSPNGEPDAIGRRGGICPTGAAQGRSGSSHGEERERISGRLPKAGREVDGFDGFGGQEAVVQTAGFGLSAELGCHVSDQRGDTCTEIEVCTIAHAQVTERLSGEASDCTHKVDPQKVGSVEVTDMTLVHQKQAAKRSGTPKGQHTQTAALVAVNSRTEIYERVGRNPSAIPVDCQAPAPLFVARFAAGWVYSVVATVGVSILEKEKRYSEAVTVLRQLLSGNHSRGRRGQWWGRLSINLDHLGRKEESLQTAETGVSDPWVRGGDRLALQRRVCRLAKPPRRWRKPHYQEAVDRLYSPTICPETRISGRPLNCTVGAKSRFYGMDNGQCGVEELALEWYASDEGGGWKGVHSEGGVWCTLFGLLMWEVLFADVEDVFRTPFQTAPLDLDTDAFFPSREAAILERLRLIQTGDVASLLAVRWATSAGTWCRGVNWERHTLEELQTIAGCVGNQGLAAVCRLLAEDHAGWAGGMPDLLLWRETKVGSDGVTLSEEGLESRERIEDLSTEGRPARGVKLSTDLGEPLECQEVGLVECKGVNTERKMSSEGGGPESDGGIEGLREGVDFWGKREAKLVEVKGPRDRLSEQQRAWIGALQAAGIAVEVCKVVEEAEETKGKQAGKKRK